MSHATISEIGREYLRLHLTADVGPVRLRNMVLHFGSIVAIRDKSMAELMEVEGIGPKVAESVFRAKGDDAVKREIERAAEEGVRILCPEDDDYPRPLLHIPDPPTCLYLRGSLEATDAVAVAIVGTRRCSHYGLEQARRFGELLGRAGFTVVSGLARGIDAAAHRGALAAGGRAIAVLGNGLSMIYPAEHAALADQIASSGAILSELAVDVAPDAKNFPPRNRIIAGLSLGTIVVEAPARSGALITARLATEYDREVFAIPGRIDEPQRSGGTNGLIRDGKAKLIACLEDVLDELNEIGDIMRPAATTGGSTDHDSPAAAGSANAGVSDEPGLFAQPHAPDRDRDGSPPAADAGRPAESAEGNREPRTPLVRLTDDEHTVHAALDGAARDIDQLHAATRLPAPRITSVLTSLQLKGIVRRLPGNRFERRT